MHTHHFSPIVCNHKTQLSIVLAPKLSTVVHNFYVLPMHTCAYYSIKFLSYILPVHTGYWGQFVV